MKIPRLSKGSTGKRVSMIRYLTETLGLKYFPLSTKSIENSSVHSTIEWTKPAQEIRLLFVITDQKDLDWSSAHEVVFQNMIKALNLKPHEVGKHNFIDISLVDYFSKLRQSQCHLPTVFFSHEPDLTGGVKSLGSHNWVEIYSFTDMIKKPDLKKLSWKALQSLLAIGF